MIRDSSSEEEDFVEEEDIFAPAALISQAQPSCSTEQRAQDVSSQPSTSNQNSSRWQNDYGRYIDIINEMSDEDDDDLYSAIIASLDDQA